MFLLLLTMAGSPTGELDWEKMMNKELHDKFQQMMGEHVLELLKKFEETMDRINGFEKTYETKCDGPDSIVH